ncbi:MAG TPA: RluA family pseudouridine synthase [Patescibacteria group bacterium]|nr:RluA family pseudouridine synthase [Patescibacteria group bacterium]
MVDNSPKINIIYEERDFLVLNKPAGVLVHHTKHEKENTLVDWLLKRFPQIKQVGEKGRQGIVHRLDKNVSGLMVVAKTLLMYNSLIEQFRCRRVEKKYMALVWGKPPKKEAIIKKPIGRTKTDQLIVVNSEKNIKNKKQAITKYKVLKEFRRFTLLKLDLLTGRTHQIRLHLKSINCPILGDKKKESFDIQRIFLHSFGLGFHDLSNQWREFEIDLPNKLKNIIKNIQ